MAALFFTRHHIFLVMDVVLISREGTVHRHPAALFARSKLVTSVLEMDRHADADPIPLVVVDDAQLALVVEFLTKNIADPVLRIYTPLVRGPLHESGVPLWAEEFVMFLSEEDVLKLLETARFMEIKM